MPLKLGILIKIAGVIGASALLAYALGYMVSQWRGFVKETYASGFHAGATDAALRQANEIERIRQAAESAAETRKAEQAAAIDEANKRASEADKLTRDALAAMRKSNATLNQCLSLPYPHNIRVHLPVVLLPPTETTSSGDGADPTSP